MSFQLENLSHQDWNQHFRNSSRPAISLARTKVDTCSLAQTAFNVSSLTKVTVAGLALSSYLHQAVTASPGQQSGLRVTVSGKRYSQVAFTRSVTVLKSQDGWRLPLIVVRKLDLCLDRRLRQQTNVSPTYSGSSPQEGEYQGSSSMS